MAIAAYAGAAWRARTRFKTGNTAFRLALGKVLVPFVFVFQPSMLIMAPGFTLSGFASSTIGCILSITALSAMFTGYAIAPLAYWEGIVLIAAAVPMIYATWPSIAIGVAIASPVIVSQIVKNRRLSVR